jgi:hypothetical protein
MPNTIELSPELQPFLALLDRLASGSMPEWRAEALWRLRQLKAEAQPVLKQKADDLDQLYQAALRGEATPEEMEHAAGVLAEREQAQAEQLVPEIAALQRKLVARENVLDPELRKAFQAGIDIAVAWLALYRDTREALLRLAAERRGAATQVLRARPVAGEVDYAELSREHMARYPKIRAALAK